ncbi:MAG: 6-phosphogluconolactonase [candidate division KSB1 bacterium]|nr:6-phosphogluconolactonase [candidate division KSB1 bacterium]
MNRQIHIYKTRAEFVEAATELIAGIVGRAIEKNGRCTIALAGGNTPREVYQKLAADPLQRRIAWRNLHLFWGDERLVPPDHPDSNFGMARAAMLAQVPIPEANVHRIKGELSPAQAAREYATELRRVFQNQEIRFDLVCLGIGEDGHTASLFPGTEAISEAIKPVAAVYVPQFDKWRVTLTLPVINRAREVVFMVAGKSKAQIVANILQVKQPETKWPASMVQPKDGVLHWLLDAEAAALMR